MSQTIVVVGLRALFGDGTRITANRWRRTAITKKRDPRTDS